MAGDKKTSGGMFDDVKILLGFLFAVIAIWILFGGIKNADRSGKFITPYDGVQETEDLKVYDEKVFNRPLQQ